MQSLYPGWQIEDLEETERLQEIQAKMDPRTETRVRDGRLFKSGELLRRRLVHEGTLLWKTSGARLKGTQHFAKNTNKKCNTRIAQTEIMCGQSNADSPQLWIQNTTQNQESQQAYNPCSEAEGHSLTGT